MPVENCELSAKAGLEKYSVYLLCVDQVGVRQQVVVAPEKEQLAVCLKEFSFVPLGFVPLGLGSINHGIWPSIRVVRGTNIKGTNLKSLSVF